MICPSLHRSGGIYRFASASDSNVQQAYFPNKPVWHNLRINDPTTLRRTRAHTSTFAPRANPSRTVETRNARNENNVPLKPLSGVNSHHRDICIKVIGETLQGALGKDANDIVEALQRTHRDAAFFTVLPQCSEKHGIGPLVIESPEVSQQFIKNGFDYFVRSRPADALSLDATSVILQNAITLNAINSGSVSEKSPLKYEIHSLAISPIMRPARAPRLRTSIRPEQARPSVYNNGPLGDADLGSIESQCSERCRTRVNPARGIEETLLYLH